MKTLLLISIFMFPLITINAQKVFSVQPTLKCGIWYDYDKAGNRIKRYFDCKDPYQVDPGTSPEQQPKISPFVTETNRGNQSNQLKDDFESHNNVAMYPNPAKDKFYIRLPKEGVHTHFHLYDPKGAIITSGNIEKTLYEGNIGNLPAGEYIIIVYYKGRAISFKIVKI